MMESSYKHDLRRLTDLAHASGVRVERLWADAAERFRVGVLTAV